MDNYFDFRINDVDKQKKYIKSAIKHEIVFNFYNLLDGKYNKKIKEILDIKDDPYIEVLTEELLTLSSNHLESALDAILTHYGIKATNNLEKDFKELPSEITSLLAYNISFLHEEMNEDDKKYLHLLQKKNTTNNLTNEEETFIKDYDKINDEKRYNFGISHLDESLKVLNTVFKDLTKVDYKTLMILSDELDEITTMLYEPDLYYKTRNKYLNTKLGSYAKKVIELEFPDLINK